MRSETYRQDAHIDSVSLSTLRALVKAAIILWFIVAMYLQYNVGLADNGDFSRIMHWISSGPVGIEPNWPAEGTEEWTKRFRHYWIPYWKIQWKMWRPPPTSAVLLWLPGGLLNSIFYSANVLYLPLLSFLPKLLLFGVLLLLLRWVERRTVYKTAFLISLGVPITLLMTTTDYVAYHNSFYRESASFVFLFAFFALLLVLKRRTSFGYLACSLAAVFLLATTKPSMLYWPLIALPFIFYRWHSETKASVRTTLVLCSTLTLIFTLGATFVSTVRSHPANPFHSFFYGALTFSDKPSVHLQRLGMTEAASCMNAVAFSPGGRECIHRHKGRISFANAFAVYSAEPLAIARMLHHVASAMQDLSLDYLGKYSFEDPRSKAVPVRAQTAEKRYLVSTFETYTLNLWALLKFRFFPTGYALLVTLIVFGGCFVYNLRGFGLRQDLALVGLLSTIACFIDMVVAIIGDGKYELIKHLFLSNLLFDVAAIAFLNVVFMYFLEFVEKRDRGDVIANKGRMDRDSGVTR